MAYCSNCGRRIYADDNFCSGCGMSVSRVTSSTVASGANPAETEDRCRPKTTSRQASSGDAFFPTTGSGDAFFSGVQESRTRNTGSANLAGKAVTVLAISVFLITLAFIAVGFFSTFRGF